MEARNPVPRWVRRMRPGLLRWWLTAVFTPPTDEQREHGMPW